MLLGEFLTQLQEASTHTIWAFQGAVAPHFFSILSTRLKDKGSFAVIDAQSTELASLFATLEMSFLGSTYSYFIKNIASLDAASLKKWVAYSQQYKGPHHLIYHDPMLSIKPSEQYLTIQIPQKVDEQLYKELSEFCYPGQPLDGAFVRESLRSDLSVDQACMLMAYQVVVGRNSSLFFRDWYKRLVIPQKSLFTLSQQLFGKQPVLFFEQWKKVQDDYPVEFWLSYWAEQVWQALVYRQQVQNDPQGAKQAVKRLPFSYLNTDWKRHSVISLTEAYQRLYALDHQLKNGGQDHYLELWYHQFLRA